MSWLAGSKGAEGAGFSILLFRILGGVLFFLFFLEEMRGNIVVENELLTTSPIPLSKVRQILNFHFIDFYTSQEILG